MSTVKYMSRTWDNTADISAGILRVNSYALVATQVVALTPRSGMLAQAVVLDRGIRVC